jgi:hypothetical protein
MHTQDKQFKETWERNLIKGRWHYGLTHGSIFGFVIFVIINLFDLKSQSISETYFTSRALYQMITMVFAGILGYSTIKWWMNQNIYKKIIEKEKQLKS